MKIHLGITQPGENPPTRLQFFCPGCQESHAIRINCPESWTWDGNVDAPTINPSVKCEYEKITPEGMAMIDRGERANIPIEVGGVTKMKYPTTPYCCHSTISAGLITFCPDCTHSLVGQTVPLPEWPERE